MGALETARHSGFERVLGFDMGGTSTDVSLADGAPRETTESTVAGFPIRVPMLDIHTVGAGGGSIARVDAGGLLRVGPESAGADPGTRLLRTSEPTRRSPTRMLCWDASARRSCWAAPCPIDVERAGRPSIASPAT